MKTTLDPDDRIPRQAKGRAVQGGVTLTKFVEDALREKPMTEHHRRPPFKLRMRTVRGERPPNVDVSNRDVHYGVIDRG